jgi:hypothetical protein
MWKGGAVGGELSAAEDWKMWSRTILHKRNVTAFQTEWKTEKRVFGCDKTSRKETHN